MEVRSSRRVRTLVTRLAPRGLSANEIARALISMMARSTTRSNQRPDTLMQDRSPPARRNLLATHGRTIHAGQSRHFDRASLTSGLPRIVLQNSKMARSIFSAKRATKRQSPIDVSSSALPKLPVSSSPVAAVPHMIIRSPRPQPGKFVFSDPKRVLQHYRGQNGHALITSAPLHCGRSHAGHKPRS